MKKSFLNIGLLILVILIVVSNAELSTAKLESKKKISDNQIEDLIPALCGGISYSELKDLKPDDIKLIDVKIPNSANWYRNFYNAYLYSTEKGNYINEVFKKDFNAVINLEYSNQKNAITKQKLELMEISKTI